MHVYWAFLTPCGSGGQDVPQGTAGLHVSPIRVDVDVSDWLLDADADTQSFTCVCVQDVNEHCVVWRKTLVWVSPLKHWTGWIQPCQTITL